MQVEMELFPMMKEQNLKLAALRLDEDQAQYYVNRAMKVFDVNVIGPQQYLSQYDQYSDLLTSRAEREADSFLLEKRTMDEMKTVRLFQVHNERGVLRLKHPPKYNAKKLIT